MDMWNFVFDFWTFYFNLCGWTVAVRLSTAFTSLVCIFYWSCSFTSSICIIYWSCLFFGDVKSIFWRCIFLHLVFISPNLHFFQTLHIYSDTCLFLNQRSTCQMNEWGRQPGQASNLRLVSPATRAGLWVFAGRA